jgi:methyl-accepting chemotaxis protein
MISLANLNSRFKIGTRINFGFLTVLVLLLVVSAVGYFGLDGSNRTFDQYVDTSDSSVKVLETDRNLTNMRRNAQVYVQNGDEQALKRVRDMGKSVRDALASLVAETASQERRDVLKKIAGLADQFMANFEQIVNSRTQRDRAVNDVMNPLGEKLRAEISEMVDGGIKAYAMEIAAYGGLAQEGLMQVRLNSYRYLIEQDPKLLEAAEQHFKKLPGLLQRLHEAMETPALRAKVRQAMKEVPEYLAAFHDAAKMIAETHHLADEVNAKLATDIFQAMAALRTSQVKTLTELKASSEASIAASIAIALAASGIALALGVFLAWFIGRGISRPVMSLTANMEALAAGKLETEVAGCDRADELGRMAKAVLVFRDAAVEKIRLEGQTAEQRREAEEERRRNADAQAKAAEEQALVVENLAQGLKSLSDGDLTFRLTDGFTETYMQVKEDFNTAVERLQETIQAIAASAREVAGASAEISGGSTDLSQRTEEQAASLEQTSASMEEISETVKKNAENAQQANHFATGTREVADRGGKVVAQAVSAMARIEQSSRKISDIISVIDEISRQTNLLALNAAVEAARAGEAGRGFAVVASEVRSLAQRSSQAAKDIKDLITNSSGQVREGVELVNKAGASLTEIMESIKKVAEIVSDIASASAEQSTGIDQVNTALSQMDEVTQQNSALVEQNAAAAKALEEQSQAMDQRVAIFQLDDAHTAGGAPVVAFKRSAAEAARQQPAAPAKRQMAAAPVRRGGPVGRTQAARAIALNDDPEWKEF